MLLVAASLRRAASRTGDDDQVRRFEGHSTAVLRMTRFVPRLDFELSPQSWPIGKKPRLDLATYDEIVVAMTSPRRVVQLEC